MSDLYQEIILEHFKHPRNQGELDDADYTLDEANQSCGDRFTFHVKLKEKDGQTVIQDIKFSGSGCAISTAASSLLTDKLKGKPISHIENIDRDYMHELLGTTVSFTRQKCLMLPVRAVKNITTLS